MVFGDGDNKSHVSGEKNMTTKFFSRNRCEDSVAKLGMQCEALFAYPQDIERICDENNTIRILQSRHITTLRDYNSIKKEFDLYEINSVHQQSLIKNNF
jgi:phosphoenolpyruvate synthase/pyruvate phosphate dikinase